MADKEDGFVESIEGQITPEKADLLADEIGEEGTLASIRARVTRIRRNPATDTDEEVPVTEPEPSAEVKAKEGKGTDKGKEKEKPAGPRFKTRAEAEKAHASVRYARRYPLRGVCGFFAHGLH